MMHSKGGEHRHDPELPPPPPRCTCSEVEVEVEIRCSDVERGSLSDSWRAPAKPPGPFNRLPRRKCSSACHDRLSKCCAPCTGFSRETHLSFSFRTSCMLHIRQTGSYLHSCLQIHVAHQNAKASVDIPSSLPPLFPTLCVSPIPFSRSARGNPVALVPKDLTSLCLAPAA